MYYISGDYYLLYYYHLSENIFGILMIICDFTIKHYLERLMTEKNYFFFNVKIRTTRTNVVFMHMYRVLLRLRQVKARVFIKLLFLPGKNNHTSVLACN